MGLQLILFVNIKGSAQSGNYCQIARGITETFNQYHYNPHSLTDSQSVFIFEESFKTLDPEGLFFTQQDIDGLSWYRLKLDDEIKQQSCAFIYDLTGLFNSRIFTADSLLTVLTESHADPEKKDTLHVKLYGKGSFVPDLASLSERWRKRLKYQVLQQLLATDSLEAETAATLKRKEPGLRKLVGEKLRCTIKSKQNHPSGTETLVKESLLIALTNSYDPHSQYFSVTEKKHFEESLSKEAKSFGLELGEDTYGNIHISDLTPGGPAWKSNKIHEGDILVRVKAAEKKEEINLSCLRAGEINERLNSLTDGPLSLTIRKKDGQVQEVSLTKEKLEIEENRIRSFVLEGERKMGYISLPGFYTNWEEENSFGCANDVAKEIIELKKEQIEGLILDLRFNGGGSLREATELAGIFIEEGPVGVMNYRNEKPQLIKDKNRGTVYDGPLLILVNNQSASASEVIASALQDYNRAIIVGSPTFGKATGQVIIPLNIHSRSGFEKQEHFVKITTSKLYRIKGITHQKSGVFPDISLPDLLEKLPIRETNLKTAFPTDEIDKKIYYTPLAPLPVNELNTLNKDRLKENQSFTDIQLLAEKLVIAVKKGKTIHLSLSAFQEKDQESEESVHSEDSFSQAFRIKNTTDADEIMQIDNHRKTINEELIKMLGEDIYLSEAYFILSDLINVNAR